MGQLDQHFLRHQERASQQLNQAVNSNRLAHALLFVGPQGSQKHAQPFPGPEAVVHRIPSS